MLSPGPPMVEVRRGMKKDIYPLSQFKHLVRRIDQPSLLQKHRRWTGNYDTDHHYHIAIPVDNDPLYFHLFWRRGSIAPAEFVGTYTINIKGLLSEGYIREDGINKVRLRICHSDDNLLYVQTKSGKPSLAIGRFPSS